MTRSNESWTAFAGSAWTGTKAQKKTVRSGPTTSRSAPACIAKRPNSCSHQGMFIETLAQRAERNAEKARG